MATGSSLEVLVEIPLPMSGYNSSSLEECPTSMHTCSENAQSKQGAKSPEHTALDATTHWPPESYPPDRCHI